MPVLAYESARVRWNLRGVLVWAAVVLWVGILLVFGPYVYREWQHRRDVARLAGSPAGLVTAESDPRAVRSAARLFGEFGGGGRVVVLPGHVGRSSTPRGVVVLAVSPSGSGVVLAEVDCPISWGWWGRCETGRGGCVTRRELALPFNSATEYERFVDLTGNPWTSTLTIEAADWDEEAGTLDLSWSCAELNDGERFRTVLVEPEHGGGMIVRYDAGPARVDDGPWPTISP